MSKHLLTRSNHNAPIWRVVLVGIVLTVVRALTVRGSGEPGPDSEANTAAALGPPFPFGRGPTSSAWREEAITRANELEYLAAWITTHPDTHDPPISELLMYVREHLRAVRTTAAGRDEIEGKRRGILTRLASSWSGADHERTLGNLDAVEATLIRLAPPSFICGEMPSLQAHINRFLPAADPRRARVGRLAAKAETEELTAAESGAVVAAVHAANTQRRRDLLRVRSFRNVMFIAALALVPLAIALAVFGAHRSTAIPLCFYPEEKQKVVCPTEETPVKQSAGTPGPSTSGTDRQQEQGASLDIDPYVDEAVNPGDIALIELIGLIAAIVTSVVSLRNVRGTSTPYSLAVALTLVKVPLGALAAVLGLVLMSGGFIPGLSALDSSAQILAWALVFGASQQLLTRLVDERANTLLENVGGRGAAGDRATSST